MTAIIESAARHDTARTQSRRRRGALTGAFLVVLLTGTLLNAASAGAHATVQLYGGEPVAGGYGHMFMRIPHGCSGGKPTDTVSVKIPAGFTSVKPERKDGWKTRIGRNEKGRVTSITWYGGNLRDDHFEDFGLSVKFPEKPGTYHLPTTQRCGRASVAWDQRAKPDENPHTLERPAPSVTVNKAAAGHGEATTEETSGAASGTTHDGKTLGKGLGYGLGHRDRTDETSNVPRGEASVLSFNGRTTLIVDLPATLRGRLATINLENRADGASAKRTLLERTPLDEDGDLLRSYPSVERIGNRWRITHGDVIIVTVGGEEAARVVVDTKK